MKQFSFWHLDQCKHLAAMGDERIIFGSCNLECTPEPHALYPVQPAFNHELISKLSRPAIINLGSHDYRVPPILGHFRESQA